MRLMLIVTRRLSGMTLHLNDSNMAHNDIHYDDQDHGSPITLSQVTTMTIRVKDADDQNPTFSQEVYRATVSESARITVSNSFIDSID